MIPTINNFFSLFASVAAFLRKLDLPEFQRYPLFLCTKLIERFRRTTYSTTKKTLKSVLHTLVIPAAIACSSFFGQKEGGGETVMLNIE